MLGGVRSMGLDKRDNAYPSLECHADALPYNPLGSPSHPLSAFHVLTAFLKAVHGMLAL